MKDQAKPDPPLPASFMDGSRPAITVDYEAYAHYLDDADVPEEQKLELLQAIWNIIVEFVSLGFGVHSTQLAQTPRGQSDGQPCGNPGAQPGEQSLAGPLSAASAVESPDHESPHHESNRRSELEIQELRA